MASLLIELTPGPNMAYLAVLSAAQGRSAGFAATAGVALGLLVVGVAAALGLAALIARSDLLYTILRWGGVVYLLWLAWDGWRNAHETSPAHLTDTSARRTHFARGLITNLMNPKAFVFYVAVLPTFLDPGRPLAQQAVALSLIYVTIATIIHIGIVLLADRARPLLEGDHARSVRIRRALSLAVALIALWFAYSTAR
jgi:threonine/homoserine/homoserine lactone efflux protein